jgi:hypothetical protein
MKDKMETLVIDPEAKTKVPLIKVPRDANGKPYYIGKLQFPGTMEFERGVSFMIFISEDGCEELQISPIDPIRRAKANRDCGRGAIINNGRVSIDIHPMKDGNGKTFYVGEAIGLGTIPMHRGVFFTVFTSIEGEEELQLTRLQFKPRQRHITERSNTFDPRRFSDVR